MSIARNAARYFKGDKAVAKQFSYSHVLKLQGSEGDKGDDNNTGSNGTTPSK